MFLGGGGMYVTADVLGIYPNQLVFFASLFCGIRFDDVFGWWRDVFRC